MIPPVACVAGAVVFLYALLALPACVLIGRTLGRNHPKELFLMAALFVFGPVLGAVVLLVICAAVVARGNHRVDSRADRADAIRYWSPTDPTNEPPVILSTRECGHDEYS